MHNCPDCDQACDCDGEDHYNSMAEDACVHVCQEYDDDEDDLSLDDEDPRVAYLPEAPHQEPDR